MNKSSTQAVVCTSHGVLSPKWLVSALVLVAVQAVAQVPAQTATPSPSTIQAPRPAIFPPNLAPKAGESLDKVIQKTMADSPLRIELLRNAFIELNPQAFPGGQASRMRTTDELKVPDAVQLLRAVAMPLMETEDAARAAAPASAEQQRRWVRFP